MITLVEISTGGDSILEIFYSINLFEYVNASEEGVYITDFQN